MSFREMHCQALGVRLQGPSAKPSLLRKTELSADAADKDAAALLLWI